MHAIIWNPQARENLSSIKNYYLEIGVDVDTVDDLLIGIFTTAEQLSNHPQSGRIVPEITDPSFREVIYMTPNNPKEPVEIMNVLHTAQKFGA